MFTIADKNLRKEAMFQHLMSSRSLMKMLLMLLSTQLVFANDGAGFLYSSSVWDSHDKLQEALYIVILFWWLPYWMIEKSFQNNQNPHSISKENLL